MAEEIIDGDGGKDTTKTRSVGAGGGVMGCLWACLDVCVRCLIEYV